MIDLEATLSDILRADPDVTARVADRAWLNMPARPTFPAVLIRRVGGIGQVSYQGWVVTDAAQVDLHCYGGSRAEALGLAHAAIAALCAATDKITVRPFAMNRIPDPTVPQQNGRDRERYIATIEAAGH